MNTDEKGRFVTGCKGGPGRPEGSRNKLTEQFYVDLYGAWQKHGAAAITEMIKDRPGDFVRCVASQMPKEMTIRTPLADMSDAELSDLITAVRTLTAQFPGESTTPGTATSTRH